MDWEEMLSHTLLGNSVGQWLLAVAVYIATHLGLKLFKEVVVAKLQELSERTKNELDDVVIGAISLIGWPFYSALALYVALSFLNLPPIVHTLAYFLVWATFLFYAVKMVDLLLDYLLKRVAHLDASVRQMVRTVGKAVIVTIIILVVLSNLGFDISALLAGLGVGGIAIAFASQRIVEDIFSYFTIHLDKPFKVGDFIVVSNEHKGTVERIGLKSTRIRSIEGEELVIANKDLVNSRIKNYGRVKKRRALLTLGVVYETPLEKLKKIPRIIEKVVKGHELAEFERCHLRNFGPSSLDYELALYVNTRDFKEFLDVLQAINWDIIKAFKKEGIEFAYPTQLVYVKLDSGGGGAKSPAKAAKSRKRKA